MRFNTQKIISVFVLLSCSIYTYASPLKSTEEESQLFHFPRSPTESAEEESQLITLRGPMESKEEESQLFHFPRNVNNIGIYRNST